MPLFLLINFLKLHIVYYLLKQEFERMLYELFKTFITSLVTVTFDTKTYLSFLKQVTMWPLYQSTNIKEWIFLKPHPY